MSVFTDHITEVHNVPMSVISRPVKSILDEEKVLSIMETLKESAGKDDVPPIDVLWVEGRNPANNYYIAVGGCHRFEAHRRLQLPTIKARLMKSTPDSVRVYMGSTTPDFE